MSFRLMSDAEFDNKHPEVKNPKRRPREFHIPSVNVVAVRDESRAQVMLQRQQGRQKAPPQPSPSYGLQKVEVLFDFLPRETTSSPSKWVASRQC